MNQFKVLMTWIGIIFCLLTELDVKRHPLSSRISLARGIYLQSKEGCLPELKTTNQSHQLMNPCCDVDCLEK